MATTSKEGSRRVNYPILTQGGSDNKSQCGTMFCNWIENNVQTLSINNWRASLVPAERSMILSKDSKMPVIQKFLRNVRHGFSIMQISLSM